VDGEVAALRSEDDGADDPVVIVGAGAAGLAAAIFARRLNPTRPVTLVDGAARPGAKILVSGGSRCNVTNTVVSERDYWGGKRTVIRRVLRALPVSETVRFFEDLGVLLKEERDGKLFPRSDRSRDVLEALLRAAASAGVTVSAATRVHEISGGDRFTLQTSRGPVRARAVVLATGGLSLPKTGSDGGGLAIARSLGHSIVPTTPALAPLMLADGFHAQVSGVAHPAGISVWMDDRLEARLRGAVLWTHFGLSGPVALDASRHILRGQLEGRRVAVSMNMLSDATFERVDALWADAAARRPKTSVRTVLAERLPASLAEALLAHLEIDGGTALGELSREDRRQLAHGLTALPLNVSGSRGYNYAEATAGGVDLSEIDPATMESRKCPSLFLIGEMLDVDGRLGGFNFQWAWSSGRAAASGLSRKLAL
jgi:predicted Rossmann fold flavoprotein